MSRFTRILSLLILCSLSSLTFSATYNYQGPPLDGLMVGDYDENPPRSITGYITTNWPLPPNQTELDIRPFLVEWYFTDDFVTLNSVDGLVDAPWNNGLPDFPKVSTDANGNIVNARILAWESPFFDEVDAVSDSLQIQGFPPPWNTELATGDVAGKIVCGSVENGACSTVSGATDVGFSQIEALGAWSISTKEASPLSGPVGPGAEAICGDANNPAPYDSAINSNLAECSALIGTLAASANLTSGEVKVYAAEEDAGPYKLNYATAAFVDLITVTEGWDVNAEATGTITLSIDGLLDDSNGNNSGTAIFDVYLWNTDEPTPACIYDSDDCGFFGGGNGHDYATAVFSLQSDGSVDARTAAAFQGSGAITSSEPANLAASLSIDWTVTRDNPSYYIGVVGYASIRGLGKVDFSQTATAKLAGPPGFEYVSRNGFNDAALLIQDLIDAVNVLNLKKGISNALDSKLMSAASSLEDMKASNDMAVVNKLYAFISNVDAQAGKMIPEQDAEKLIASAQSIIELLLAN